MATDWMGPRLPIPNKVAVERGLFEAEGSKNHYISKFFYPKSGGFQEILKRMTNGHSVNYGFEIEKIDLAEKTLEFRNGEKRSYDLLINTLPIPDFVRMSGAPSDVLSAAGKLQCTSLTIVNIVGERRKPAKYNWLYVYDEEYLSTRVSFVETLSRNNVAKDKVALQIEVYDKGDQTCSDEEIKNRVCDEAIEQGWIERISDVMHQRIEYANVVSGIDRRANLDVVLNWLCQYGLVRENMIWKWSMIGKIPANSLGEM
jgi:Protoporphyrinogen oxidase